jgi:hypothetical protein
MVRKSLHAWFHASLPALLALAAAGTGTSLPALDLNGFLPGRGQGDVALSYTTEGYDEFWVGETKVSDPGVGEVEIKSFSLWLQWGLTDNLAVVANLPHVDAGSDGLGGFEDSGLQDLTALLKFRFLASGPHSLTGAAGVRAAAQNYEANLPVDLGDNTTDALLRLVYQFQAGNFYVSQQVGYDVRGDDAPDGFPLYTELGFTAGRVTYGGYYSRLIADGGTDIGDPGFTFPSNQEEYSRAGFKVYGRITERFGFSAAYFLTLDGRNTGDSDGFSVGAVSSF